MICSGCEREVPDDGDHGSCASCRTRWAKEENTRLTHHISDWEHRCLKAENCFRRACEKLAMTPFPPFPVDFKPPLHVAKRSTDEWQAAIEKELEKELGK